MKTTPIKLLTEQINHYKTFKQIVIDKYKNGEITELKKDSVICDTEKQIQTFEDAVKNLTPQPKPRANKKALRLFGVVPSFLQVFVEILGYCAFSYIVCFLIFGGEFHIEIYFKESIEALKNILN